MQPSSRTSAGSTVTRSQSISARATVWRTRFPTFFFVSGQSRHHFSLASHVAALGRLNCPIFTANPAVVAALGSLDMVDPRDSRCHQRARASTTTMIQGLPRLLETRIDDSPVDL